MEKRKIESLYDSPLNNFTEISDESNEALQEELKKGQHSTILVFDNGDGTAEILGGKHRVADMKKMGFTDVKCVVLTAKFVDGEGFYPILDGEEIKTVGPYSTLEKLKMAYIASHNHISIRMNPEKLKQAINSYALEEWDRLRLPVAELPKVKSSLAEFNLPLDNSEDMSEDEKDNGVREKKLKEISCPSCQYKFTI